MKDKDLSLLNISIGSRVQKIRAERNLTQEKFAELLGCSRNHLSALERGTSAFSIERLMNVCKILNVSADQLLFDGDPKSIAAPIVCRLEELDPKHILFIERFLDLYIDSLKTLND